MGRAGIIKDDHLLLNPGMQKLDAGSKLVVVSMSRSDLQRALVRRFTPQRDPRPSADSAGPGSKARQPWPPSRAPSALACHSYHLLQLCHMHA